LTRLPVFSGKSAYGYYLYNPKSDSEASTNAPQLASSGPTIFTVWDEKPNQAGKSRLWDIMMSTQKGANEKAAWMPPNFKSIHQQGAEGKGMFSQDSHRTYHNCQAAI